MSEQSEGNNHTSKINVFPVLHTIFFLLAGQKVDLFAPHGAIKSTLWPASRKNKFSFGSKILSFSVEKKTLSRLRWDLSTGLSIAVDCSIWDATSDPLIMQAVTKISNSTN